MKRLHAPPIMTSTKIVLFGTLLAVLFLLSCCSSLSDYRQQGFDAFQWQFNAVKNEDKDFHKVITLDTVTVHIVTDRKYFDWNIAAAYGSPVAGYANTNNEIWLFGKRVRGKIFVNQAILGHELNHLLNFKNREVVDPDRLDEIGL